MGFMRPAPAPQVATPEVTAVQERAEQRAEASERQEVERASARMRLMRSGGLRLLFSPARQDGGATRSSLGSSGGTMQ
jgi:hypothetical protein